MPLANPEERKGNMVFPKEIIASADWLAKLWEERNVLQGKIKLIAWGMKDIAFREKELNHWKKHFPNVNVVRYADAGHFLAEENPEEVITELENILAN